MTPTNDDSNPKPCQTDTDTHDVNTESPMVMLKRIFAVANIIAKSPRYVQQSGQKTQE